MSKHKNLDVRRKVIELRRAGKNYEEIAKELNITYQQAYWFMYSAPAAGTATPEETIELMKPAHGERKMSKRPNIVVSHKQAVGRRIKSCPTCKDFGLFPRCPNTRCGKSSASQSRAAVKPATVKPLLKPAKSAYTRRLKSGGNPPPGSVTTKDRTLVVFPVQMRKPSLWTVLVQAYKAWKTWGVDESSLR